MTAIQGENPRMRLALVFERVEPSRGGAETYVADLARRLVAAGHDVDLYANGWAEGVLPGVVRCVPVPIVGRTRASRIRCFAENAAAALDRSAYDCSVGFINTISQDVLIPQGGVHPASLDANSRRFPAGWRRGLYTFMKRANPKYSLYRAIEERQYDPRNGSRYVAVSRMVQGHLERYYQVAPERVRVIPNAIDADRLDVADHAAVRARFRLERGLGPNDLVALFVAHNFKLKGLTPLLHALARRNTGAGRRIHLLVCGGGKPAAYRGLVKRLGLDAQVHFLGFVRDVRDPFHAADFFVLPSYYDPCSLVVFEALACGLPVITTATNGAGEVMTQGREGFVVSAADAVSELATAFEAMDDNPTRQEMSIAARNLGREQSFDRHMGRLIDLFRLVATEKARGHATPHFNQRAPSRQRGGL